MKRLTSGFGTKLTCRGGLKMLLLRAERTCSASGDTSVFDSSRTLGRSIGGRLFALSHPPPVAKC